MRKLRDRETLENGVVSKLQKPIVSQRMISIVFHLFATGFMTNDYLTILGYQLTFTCVFRIQWTPLSFVYVSKDL